MLPALATLHDMEARLGLDNDTLAGASRSRAQAALDDASALIREEARRTWIVEGVVVAPDAIIRVCLGAAMRNYRNPEGEVQQTVGPFSRTLNVGETGVYLTPQELEIVRRYLVNARALWTQRTTRGEGIDSTLYLEDSFGCELFPVGTLDKPWL